MKTQLREARPIQHGNREIKQGKPSGQPVRNPPREQVADGSREHGYEEKRLGEHVSGYIQNDKYFLYSIKSNMPFHTRGAHA
jgi:hypothetical protein